MSFIRASATAVFMKMDSEGFEIYNKSRPLVMNGRDCLYMSMPASCATDAVDSGRLRCVQAPA